MKCPDLLIMTGLPLLPPFVRPKILIEEILWYLVKSRLDIKVRGVGQQMLIDDPGYDLVHGKFV